MIPNMSSNSVNSSFYTVLPGTVPYGTIYENRIISLLWLKILNQENVEDCSMSANDDNYGKLDDVIFNISYKNKMDQKYLLQLKYEQKGRNVQPDALFGTLSSSKKQENDNKPGDQNKEDSGNFNLSKYINSFVANLKKFQNSFLILYTNRGFHPGTKSLTFYWKLKNKSVISIPINAVIFHDENCNFFNTSRNSGALYQFEMQDFDDSDLTAEEKQNLELFFRYFIFFTSQIDLDGSRQEMGKLLKYYLGDLKDYEGLYCKYMNFFNDWSMRPKERPKLTENIIKAKITEFVISPFIIPFTNPPQYQEKSDILISAISDFEVTFIRSDFNKFVEEVGYLFVQKCKTDVKEFIIIARKLVILEPKQEIKSISDFTHNQMMQILRFKGEIPWAIHVTPSNKRSVQRIFTTVFKNSNFVQKYLLLLDEDEFDDFTHCQVFKHLGDLGTKSPTKLDTLIDHLSVTVMDKQISLRHLTTDKKYPLELIRVHNVIQMMDKTFVFGKNSVKVPDFYLNRVIIKPVILKTLLAKECNSLFVVSNSIDYPMQWDNFGKMSINLDLEQEDSYDGNKKLLYTKKKITYEYFNQLKPLSLHNFKLYAFELLSDGNLTCIFAGGLLDFDNGYTTPILVKDREVFKEFTNDITLLVADTGMGKSVLMDYLVQNCPSDYWPLKINVREHYTFFQSHAGNGNDVLKYFLNDPLDKFSKDIRDMYVKEKKVFIVWDGLDEFPVGEIDKVIEKIKKVRLIGCPQWITSKRHLSEKLMTEFEVIPASLTRLSVPEQNSYIRERLKFFYQQSEIDAITTKLHDFIANIKWREVLGIPLLLFLFTDVYTNFEAVNIGNSLSLDEIYEHFINGKFKIMTQKKDIHETTANALLIQQLKREKDQLHKHYQEAAVLSNFDKDVQQCLNLKGSEFINQILAEGDENGLIIKVSDDKRAIFLHNTLGDYFAAFYLVNIWETIGTEFRQKILTLLFQEKYQSIKTFFDCLFAKGSEPHKLVLAQEWEQVEKFPTDVLCCTDKGGRSVLHLMCMFDRKYAKVHIKDKNQAYYFWIDPLAPENDQFQRVFSNICARTTNWDSVDLAGWAPLQYADQNASYYALNMLLPKYPTIEVKQFKSYHPTTILFNACVYGYAIYFKKILNYMSNDLLEMCSERAYNEMYGPTFNNLHLPSWHELPLHIASKNGYNDVVILLVSKGININNSSSSVDPPLYMASEMGHLSVVKTLLDNGASISKASIFSKKTCLHVACAGGHASIVRELMKRGADIKMADVNRRIPLHLAIMHGHEEAALALIEAGIDGSICDIFGEVLLNLASKMGQIGLVEAFLKNGTNLQCQCKYGYTPLHFAAQYGRIEIANLLLGNGADWTISDFVDGETPLHLASANGHLNVVRVLIDKGADVSITDKYGQTPLHLASLSRFLDVMEFLIIKGADKTALDVSGRTPLHLAAYNKYLDVALVLVGNEDRFLVGSFGQTSLHLAALHGYLEFVEALTAKTNNVSPIDNYGQTPLHIASEGGYVDVALNLLQSGADLSILDNFGQTALHLAAINRHPDVVRVLMSYGASRLVYNDYGHTPLGLALLRRLPDVIRALLYTFDESKLIDEEAYGLQAIHYSVAIADDQQMNLWIKEQGISLQTNCGNTALHVAVLVNEPIIVQMLLHKGIDVSVVNRNGHRAADLAVTPKHDIVLSLLGITLEGNSISLFCVDATHPVHLAIIMGETDLVKLLFHSHSGCENVADSNGRTPLHLSALYGRLDVTKLLIVKMVDVHIKDSNGATSLHLAAKNGHLEVVELLLQCGSPTGVKDHKGLLPLDYAKKGCYRDIVNLLMEIMHDCVLEYI